MPGSADIRGVFIFFVINDFTLDGVAFAVAGFAGCFGASAGLGRGGLGLFVHFGADGH